MSEHEDKPNPILLLLRSRKFLILLLDTVISCVLFFVAKYATGSVEDVKILIAVLQPVVVALIIAIAVEDAAEKSNPSRIWK